MKKVRFGIGGAVILAAAFIGERGELIVIYVIAALIHESGHLLAAKAMNIGIEYVEFGFFGVRICVDRGLCSYRTELILAIFGPLMNFVAITTVFLWAHCAEIAPDLVVERGISYIECGGSDKVGMLGFFAIASFAQAVINLLPVHSLDGGRILYCALAVLIGENTASIAVSAGTAFAAFVLWTAALYLLLKVSAGLSLFVFAACIFFACRE